MTDDRGTLRTIAWRDLLPWLLIFKTFWLSLSIPLLLLATAGVVVQPLGWQLADLLFLDDEIVARDGDLARANNTLTSWPEGMTELPVLSRYVGQTSLRALVRPSEGDYANIFDTISFPFVSLFDRTLELTTFAYFLFGSLWTLALWTIIGGTITRVAVVFLGLEERVSARDALIFTLRRFGQYFVAPLYPILGIGLLALPIAVLGLVMTSNVGVLIAGIVWVFVLIAALGMAFLAVGLLFGWPLMWPVISAENGDAFEALSRSFGYTFQRPFHYAFYVLVATLFAALCWLFVGSFATVVVHMADWGASWGAGYERIALIERAAYMSEPYPAEVTSTLRTGAKLIRFWEHLVLSVATGFAYSLFFCLASAIYLLLRQVDDETEFDEVYLDDDDERYTLPEVKRDPANVPTMSTPPMEAPPAAAPPAPPDERPLSEEE